MYHRSDGKRAQQSCTDSVLLQAASVVPAEEELHDHAFSFPKQATRRYSALFVDEKSDLPVGLSVQNYSSLAEIELSL